MSRYYHYKGSRIPKDEVVWVPSDNLSLPCKGAVKQVSVRVCIEAECENFRLEDCGCQKFLDEHNKRHKPPAFKIDKMLRTPSGGGRGFWGKKNIETGGFK